MDIFVILDVPRSNSTILKVLRVFFINKEISRGNLVILEVLGVILIILEFLVVFG